VDMYLQLQYKGGVWQQLYNDVLGGNIWADTILRYEPKVPNTTDILDRPNVDEDSVTLEVKFVLRRYSADYAIADLLMYNDTCAYTQKFYDYYAYDDGSSENGYGIYGENAQAAEIAVKFHAYRADTLSGVYIYFNHTVDTSNLQPFLLMVHSAAGDMPADELYREQAQAKFTGMNQFIWYEFKKRIVVNGDFFVGIKQQNSDMLNIGVDMNNHATNKTYMRYTTNWMHSDIDNIGALMIRPVFSHTKASISTSVPKYMQQPAITVYPNPVRQSLNISLSDEINYEGLMINIVDIMGRNVYSCPFAWSVDVGNLPQGMYILQLLDAKGNVVAWGKVIIN